MASCRDLHRAAMAAANQADFFAPEDVKPALYTLAFELEEQAAAMVRDDLDAEPTRAILHRSAACLAIVCGRLDDAERLARIGLDGRPPSDIAEELRDLLARVEKERSSSDG